MFVLGVILLGVISFVRLPIDLLPDVSYPRLVIHTTYDEVGPEEVEALVTERVESAGARVPGVEEVESVSRDGVSLVTLRFAWGTDMDFAMLNVREALGDVEDFLPDDVDRPQVLRVDPEAEPVMALSVAGGEGLSLWDVKDLADNVFRRRLEQLEGVAQVQTTGGLEREVQVVADARLMESYGVTFEELSEALDRANHSGGAGTVLQGQLRYPLRALGEFRTVGEMDDVVVDRSGLREDEDEDAQGERLVRVRDVAEVHDAFGDRRAVARYNGSEAVGLLVFEESGANTVAVAERVDEVLEQLSGEFDEVAIDVAHSQAGFISESIDNVVQALVLGGVLAFVVLFFFLREPRYPVAVALAIPISVIGTFALMDAFGVSLNIMSLGGLALGVGMLVDNSIIVLENIFRHREEGKGAIAGAGVGAEEVMKAIAAATLTTISVFLPIIYVEGVAGELFRDLSLAVAFSLLASLFVAITLLPTLSARFQLRQDGDPEEPLLPGPRPQGKVRSAQWAAQGVVRLPGWLLRRALNLGRALLHFWWNGLRAVFGTLFGPLLRGFDRAFSAFARRYHGALAWSLDHRGRVLGMAALVFAGAVGLGLLLDRDLLPDVDQGAFDVTVALEEGTPLSSTEATAQEVEEALLDDPGVEAVFSQVGRDVRTLGGDQELYGLHNARLQVRVAEGSRTSDVVERIRPVADEHPDASMTFETGQATALGQLLGGTDADIAVRVRGEDLDESFELADAIRDRLEGSERVGNLRVGTERGHPEIRVIPDREAASRYGVTAQQIVETVQTGMRGHVATEYRAFDQRVPVRVRLPDTERYDAETLERLRVGDVPLREVVSIEEGRGPAEVRRQGQERVVAVQADVMSGGLGRAIEEVEAELAGVTVPPDLRVEVGGENEEMHRSFQDLAFAFVLALIIVYMILAAQFESFVQPFTILGAVPLALVGALLALWLAGHGLNTLSLIGVVILVGIVVNDSIVKVDFINQARERGAAVRDAILEAGRVRLRPIIMTTVTTVLGLTPMALGIGRGADLRAPLAVAVIGGLLVATLLTLIVVPVIYSVIDSLRLRVMEVVAREPAGSGGSEPGTVPAAPPEGAP